MPPRRNRGGRVGSQWAFLDPWLAVLRANVARPPTQSLALRVTFHCWLRALSGAQRLTRDCKILLRFPADPTTPRQRQHLQRLREAIELFNALAAVDSVAFATLLAPYFVRSAEWLRSGYELDEVDHLPVWSCYLTGTCHFQVNSKIPITWSSLFGCPKDPWEYSNEYRAAATKLQEMKEVEEVEDCVLVCSTKWKVYDECIKIREWRREPDDSFGNTIFHNSWDETLTKPTEEYLVREMGKRWEKIVPVATEPSCIRVWLSGMSERFPFVSRMTTQCWDAVVSGGLYVLGWVIVAIVTVSMWWYDRAERKARDSAEKLRPPVNQQRAGPLTTKLTVVKPRADMC